MVKRKMKKTGLRKRRVVNRGIRRPSLWKRGVMTIGALSARMKDPFPQRKFCTIRYSDNITITAPSTNLAYEYIYSLNGLFDPDFTGGGSHQGYGYDTMALLYNLYIVRGVYIKIEWYDPSADGVQVGYRIQGSSVSGASVGALEESPLTMCTALNNTGIQKTHQRIYVRPWDAIGTTKYQYLNDVNANGAAVTANPSVQGYLRLFAVSTQSGAASTVKMKIEISYYTEFYNRVTLAQST